MSRNGYKLKSLKKFTSEVGIHPLDEREETLSQHLLLLLRRSGGQHTRGQRLLHTKRKIIKDIKKILKNRPKITVVAKYNHN